MKGILLAIKNAFAVSGLELYLQEAPVNTPLPYCVYYFINGAKAFDMETYNSNAEEIEIQFSIFTDTAANALDFQTALWSIFDDKYLTIPGYRSVFMERSFYRTFKDENNQQAVTSYNILTDKEK